MCQLRDGSCLIHSGNHGLNYLVKLNLYGLAAPSESERESDVAFQLGPVLCIYLEINTNYKYPLSRTGTPVSGTDTTSVKDWYPL